ncbi:MAG: hypothetical protein QM751_14135 [Paludibacteraceae bacterium]
MDITFTNGSTTRPIIITDGGSGNDITAYPTTANVEKTVTFMLKSPADDDIVIKTGGSSGLTITKMVFYGLKNGTKYIMKDYEPFFSLKDRKISSGNLLSVTDISGRIIAKNTYKVSLNPGIYIVQSGFKAMKIVVK